MPSHNNNNNLAVELPSLEKLEEFKKNEETLQELNTVIQEKKLNALTNKSTNQLDNENIILKSSSVLIETKNSDSGKLKLTPLNVQTPSTIAINESALEQANNAIHRRTKFKLAKWLKKLWKKLVGIIFIISF